MLYLCVAYNSEYHLFLSVVSIYKFVMLTMCTVEVGLISVEHVCMLECIVTQSLVTQGPVTQGLVTQGPVQISPTHETQTYSVMIPDTMTILS